MKVAFLCCVLFLAGSATCSPTSVVSDKLIPDNIIDWIVNQIANFPDSVQDIIAQLPEIVEAIREKLPEIIAGIPAVVDQIRDIVIQIIEKIPELIPIIVEKIPEVIAAIPEIIEKIKEILGEYEFPDWFPEIEKPDWWPIEIPELPEINQPVPGTPTTVSEFPSVVQIEVGTGPIWAQGCAGTVLTNLHVLSAARCFSGLRYDNRFRRVRAGSSTRFTDGAIVEINRAVNHPSFNGNFPEADITVVRLVSFLIFGSQIQQSPIIPADFILPEGLTVTQVGWGSTAQGKLISDRDLYKIDLVISSQADCAARWERVPLFELGSDKICVARPETGGRNSDLRDIGSPVYYSGILSGIVSFGAPVGNQYFPVIATSVASYTNWIIETAV